MKNTTKLKNILQLYSVTLDIEDEGNIILTMISKADQRSWTFVDKSYSVVVGKAFGKMKKELKNAL